MTTLLTVHNLGITYQNQTLIHPLSFDLQKGEELGVTGVSGSGKSLTAYALMGLLPQGITSSGTFTFQDQNFSFTDDLQSLRGNKIGMVFQEPMTALNPLMTIGDQVSEVFIKHRQMSKAQARTKSGEVLMRVGLGSEVISPHRYPHELSGGQKQRVAIAMAIALKPVLLIADEPTTSLDTITQKEILTLMQNLVRDDKMAMILITHDLAIMAENTDRLLVMNKGVMTSLASINSMLAPKDKILSQLIQSSRLKKFKHGKVKEEILKLDHISKIYSHGFFAKKKSINPAVDDVSINLKRKGVIGIVGRSGCGKTSLSKIALGLLKPSHGKVTFNHHSISADFLPLPLRGKISAVFQDPYSSFNPRKPILDLIAEPLDMMPEKLSKTERLNLVHSSLKDVGIASHYTERFIHQCSGGERQRLAFARAMITKPEVIILDEATSALDAPHRQQLLSVMHDASKRNDIALILISHDLSLVRAFCAYAIVMSGGKIVEEGATEDIFSSPQHSETKLLIAAMPDLNEALSKLKGGSDATR